MPTKSVTTRVARLEHRLNRLNSQYKLRRLDGRDTAHIHRRYAQLVEAWRTAKREAELQA